MGTENLLDALGVSDPASDRMRAAIEKWTAMHMDAAPWLNAREGVHSLNLPATISAELSRLATLEMESVISGGARADFLNETYQKVIADARVFTEHAAARGDLILKPRIRDGTLSVDYVKAGEHFSLAFDSNGYSTSELFLESRSQNGKLYVRAEIQTFADEKLTVTNSVFVRDEKGGNYRPASLSDVEEWAHMEPSATIYNVEAPLWGHLKMPFANQIDPSSPLGVSVFSRAVGLIEQADRQYSRLLWEMEAGKFALYVDETAFPPDRYGRREPPDKRLFVGLDVDRDKGGLFEAWAPALREQSIINGLNEILTKIEDTCGLARGTFSDRSEGQAMTATQIKILRQRTYATVTDMQKALDAALNRLAYAMDVWASVGGLAPAGPYEVDTQFDDSVITDRTETYQRLREAVSDGTLRPEYLLRELGIQPMSEGELAAARALMPELSQVE